MKTRYRVFLYYLFFSCSISHAQTLWQTVSPFPENPLKIIVAPDTSHLKGAEISSPGRFAYSNDGGDSWNYTPLNFYIFCLYFTDSTHGWIGSDSGRIAHTVDGGQTWNIIQLQSQKRFTVLQFLSDSIGFALTNTDSIFVTHDEGINWAGFETNIVPGNYQKILFTDSLKGWLINGSNDPFIYRTNDGGRNWTAITLPSPMGGYDDNAIYFIDSLNGWLTGSAALMRTTNGGNSWFIISSVVGGDVAFKDNQNGVRADIDGYIFITQDGGLSWSQVFAPGEENFGILPGVTFCQQTYFVYTYRYSFLKSTDGFLWKNITWNGFLENSINQGYFDFSSPSNGIFILPSHCTPVPCPATILVTTDTGRIWKAPQTISFDASFQIVSDNKWFFVKYYYLSDSSAICLSTDYLQSFVTISIFPDKVGPIYFLDSLNGVVGANPSPLFTHDGGVTWRTCSGLNTPLSVQNFSFTDSLNGWLIDKNYLARTFDRGETWNIIYTNTGSFFKKSLFTDTLNGFILCENGNIIKTNDGGISWTNIANPINSNDIYFIDSLRGWIATQSGIYYTDDGLNNTTLQFNRLVYSLSFYDHAHGFASGNSLLLRTDQTNIINNILSLSNSTHEINVYPNPATGSINISSDKNINEIQITDESGRRIFSKKINDKTANINLIKSEPGIYFMKLLFENEISFKKIIISR